MDPYLPQGMLRTRVSVAVVVVGPNNNQQLTVDNGEVQSMRLVLARMSTPATVQGF